MGREHGFDAAEEDMAEAARFKREGPSRLGCRTVKVRPNPPVIAPPNTVRPEIVATPEQRLEACADYIAALHRIDADPEIIAISEARYQQMLPGTE